MKKLLLSVLATICLTVAIAQPSASWSTSLTPGFPIVSAGVKYLDGVDQNVVWLTGYDGTAISRNYVWYAKSTNGGTSFSYGPVVSGTNAVLGDTNKYVIASIDGVDANTAWVAVYTKSISAKGTVFKTINGGTNWTDMNNGNMFVNAASFCNFATFGSQNVGIAQGDPILGEFEIWRTTNGGASFTQIPGANIPNPLVGEFGIVNVFTKHGTSNIWFGTNMGRMYYSNDGGLNWLVSNVVATPAANIYILEVAFSSPLHGVTLVSNNGTGQLYNTTNGGATWNFVNPLPANTGLNDVAAVPGSNAFISCGAGTGNQLISSSVNNGAVWTDFGSVGIQYLTVDMVSPTVGWAGSFSDPTTPALGGVWKYTGAAFSGTLPPTANFVLPIDLCLSGANVTVSPSNTSYGSTPLNYSWTASAAGVGFSSPTASVPVITFTANGTYSITLEATNGNGTNTSTQIIIVQTCIAPAMTFTTAGNPCNAVSFTVSNTSLGIPTPLYSWSSQPAAGVNFLPSASAASPSLNITTPGTYTITLAGTNAAGTASTTQIVTVANCAPSVAFGFPANGCILAPITTSNTSTGATSYTWTWAPAGGVFQANAPSSNKTFTFTVAGIYTVTLKATNASGTNIAVQTITVVDCSVDLAEQRVAGFDVEVYPNPARDEFQVSLPAGKSGYRVSLVNVLGAVVYETKTVKTTADKLNIVVGNQPKGVYFLNVESDEMRVTRKIVLE